MLPQVQGPEHTTEAREAEVQRWLLNLLRRHGPGRYLLQVSPDGRITVKVLTPAFHVVCPDRLRLDAR